jgi:16S rRNA processing protein RimM
MPRRRAGSDREGRDHHDVPGVPGGSGDRAGKASRVCVAQIGAAHGVRGEVRLRAFTEDPMAITRYGILDAEDGLREFEIEQIRAGPGGLVAKIAGVTTRTAAEQLTNTRLYVPRERLPAIEDDDTYYHADLIGLSVYTAGGESIGRVAAVHDFGAGELLEIERPVGPSVLVPFTRAAVPIVDVANSRLVVDPPEGLLDMRTKGEGH